MVRLQISRCDTGTGTTWSAAFPAFAWLPVLASPQVELRLRADDADIRVRARGTNGTAVLAEAHVAGEWSTTLHIGAWQWLWVEGDVTEIVWSISEQAELPRVTAVVPTFGRPVEALTQSSALLAADVVGHVVVVDQGATLADDAGFERLRAEQSDRLVLLSQDNLGGSGGYARGMLESRRWPADAVFLSDDDAAIDPESLRRMVVLQALAARRGQRCIVATGMLAAERPELLISLAERIEPRRFWWCAADGLTEPLDIGQDLTTWVDMLVPTHPTDYGGWWGTLLPPGAVGDLGLPAPYFLKWDDAEYGLRARRRGWSVRALPGVAVRHPTWAAKGTSSSWASLPMHRNRLVTAAAYGAGRGVILDSLMHQVKHVLSLQYPTAELWQHASQQVLAGPSAWLGSDLRHVRTDAQRLLDAMPQPSTTDGEVAVGAAAPFVPSLLRAIAGLWLPRPRAPRRQRRVAGAAHGWRDGLGSDRVIVDGPDGAPREVLERDPRRARRLLRDTFVSHLQLARRWSRLSAQYRAALPSVTTVAFWHEMIGLEPPT